MSIFPGAEDYEEGQSPVRDLGLLNQIKYWKARAKVAEESAHESLERVADIEDEDPADFWKRDDA